MSFVVFRSLRCHFHPVYPTFLFVERNFRVLCSVPCSVQFCLILPPEAKKREEPSNNRRFCECCHFVQSHFLNSKIHEHPLADSLETSVSRHVLVSEFSIVLKGFSKNKLNVEKMMKHVVENTIGNGQLSDPN